MIIEYDTDDNSKYFASSYDKRDNMLLKLFDHAIYKNLPYSCQYRQYKEVKSKLWMLRIELDCKF